MAFNYRHLWTILVSLVLVFLALGNVSAEGMVPADGYGFYYHDGSWGAYYYSSYGDGYQYYHYPDSYYDGYYTYSDFYAYDGYYYAPSYGYYYYPSTYMAEVMPDGYYPYPSSVYPDSYYPYPDYIYPDGYYPYPQDYLVGYYDQYAPYFSYWDYYIPYGSYGYYNYPYGYNIYYPGSYGYSGYYSYPYAYPGDAHSGFEGDAGTVSVELGERGKAFETEQGYQEEPFKHYLVEQNYGYTAPHNEDLGDAPDSGNSNSYRNSASNSVVVINAAENENPASQTNAGSQASTATAMFQASPNTPSCTAVSLQTKAVSVETGAMAEKELVLRNSSFETFYIERFNASSPSPYLEAYAIGFDREIGAGSTGKLNVRILAADLASDTKVNLTVYGHFASGKSCGFGDIKESFEVDVSPGSKNFSCHDFSLSAPSKVMVEKGHYSISIHNPLNESVLVSLQGEGVTVNPSAITVSPQTFVEKEVFFEADGQAQLVRYDIAATGCNIPSKLTFFSTEEGEIELMSYSSQLDNSSRTVYLTLKNHSPQAKAVDVSLLNLPEGFEANPQKVSLEPFEEKAVALNLKAEVTEAVSFDSKLTVSFSGKTIERTIPVSFGQGDVSLTAEVVETIAGDYALKLSLVNNSQDKVEGFIDLAEKRWQVKGDRLISLNPKEAKELTLVVTPDQVLKKTLFVPVSFVQASGKTKQVYAVFSPLKGALATAFVTLGATTAIGLFALLIIVLALFVRRLQSKSMESFVDAAEPGEGLPSEPSPNHEFDDDYFF